MPPAPLGLVKSLAFDDPFALAVPGLLQARLGPEIGLVYAHPARDMEHAREAVLAVAATLDASKRNWAAEGFGLRTPEDAASFASAGYTSFVFDISGQLDPSAYTMSVEELDAAVVKLEDRHCYASDWHEAYLEDVFTPSNCTPLKFSEETVARVAVKFGRALAHAQQMLEALRTCWTGQAGLPDIGISLAHASDVTTPLEHLFLGLELRQRGFGLTSLTPSFGSALQVAVDYEGDMEVFMRNLAEHVALARYCGPYKLGIEHAAYKTALIPQLHQKCGELLQLKFDGISWLEALRVAARHDAPLFRELLTSTREVFPMARQGQPISTTEEDARFLPQVKDHELETTFLDSTKGRQILQVTSHELLAGKDSTGQPFHHRLRQVLSQHEELYGELLAPQFTLGKL